MGNNQSGHEEDFKEENKDDSTMATGPSENRSDGTHHSDSTIRTGSVAPRTVGQSSGISGRSVRSDPTTIGSVDSNGRIRQQRYRSDASRRGRDEPDDGRINRQRRGPDPFALHGIALEAFDAGIPALMASIVNRQEVAAAAAAAIARETQHRSRSPTPIMPVQYPRQPQSRHQYPYHPQRSHERDTVGTGTTTSTRRNRMTSPRTIDYGVLSRVIETQGYRDGGDGSQYGNGVPDYDNRYEQPEQDRRGRTIDRHATQRSRGDRPSSRQESERSTDNDGPPFPLALPLPPPGQQQAQDGQLTEARPTQPIAVAAGPTDDARNSTWPPTRQRKRGDHDYLKYLYKRRTRRMHNRIMQMRPESEQTMRPSSSSSEERSSGQSSSSASSDSNKDNSPLQGGRLVDGSGNSNGGGSGSDGHASNGAAIANSPGVTTSEGTTDEFVFDMDI